MTLPPYKNENIRGEYGNSLDYKIENILIILNCTYTTQT